MKKILSILSSLGIVASSSALVVSCINPSQEKVASQVQEIWNKDFKNKVTSAKNYSMLVEEIKKQITRPDSKSLIKLADQSKLRERPKKGVPNQKLELSVGKVKLTLEFGDVKEGKQATKYVDEHGQIKETFDKDLENHKIKKIVQIGYYEHEDNHDGNKLHIRAVPLPKIIEEVPAELPKEITSTRSMFYGTETFNQDISGWDTSNLETIDQMFMDSKKFNIDISKWNVSNVRILDYAFSETEAFNQDLSKWDVSNVTSMERVFQKAKVFNNGNKPLTWNEKTKNVKNMNSLFNHAYKFNQDISGWDVSSVTNMEQLFTAAFEFNQDLSKWNVKNVKNMRNMFYSAHKFNQDISGWDTSNVEDMGNMFLDAKAFNQNISDWKTTKVKKWDAFDHESNNEWKKEHKPKVWQEKSDAKNKQIKKK
ncbi:BspA family leucine-rich repeat surface protein [Metamycoplasma alkalescens]|nr:BspA family leucine-rich repeat surface protein [Metamycoplasma alkalescens]